MNKLRVSYLRDGKTVNGQKILLDGALEQNWLRTSLSQLQHDLSRVALAGVDPNGNSSEIFASLFAVVDALKSDFQNPDHYGDNQPGLFDSGGRALLPKPVFTYWDLLQFGVTGEDGLQGFLDICSLPATTTQTKVFVATGWLLVDAAVSAANHGRDAFAGHLMFQATQCESEARLDYLQQIPIKELKAAVSKMRAIAGERSGVTRSVTASEKLKEVQDLQTHYLARGRDKRDLAALIAPKVDLTPDYVRQLLKKPK